VKYKLQKTIKNIAPQTKVRIPFYTSFFGIEAGEFRLQPEKIEYIKKDSLKP